MSMPLSHRILRRAALASTIALLPGAVSAQARYESPDGPVEVMGLRTWTLPMLRDSIRHYVPGQELHDAACQVTLREKLGFADAQVMYYSGMTGDGKRHLLIKLVEPAARSRVQWNPAILDRGASLRPGNAELLLPITDSTGGVHIRRVAFWLQFAVEERAAAVARMPEAMRAEARADADRLSAFQRARATESHRRMALEALSGDAFWGNRYAAATVLANFGAHDSTWLALVHALRDPNEGVRGAALGVLGSLPPRSIDWRPAIDDLRALLGGTNVSGIGPLMRVLVKTRIAPELAAPLLQDNADWVLEHLRVAAPMVAGDARALLRQLNGGADLGSSPEAWSEWASRLSLPQPR
ncbi:MAG: HEAT repeat domain-containing protein [Gemmatimonadaceae bacterium]|nr:HEAT repeat domain-containing protein [Gemmatimonadaceae bacterium]